jgi:hypothetical protein
MTAEPMRPARPPSTSAAHLIVVVVTQLDGRTERLLRYALSFTAATVVAVHVLPDDAAAPDLARRWMTGRFAAIPLYLLNPTSAGIAPTIAGHVSTRLDDRWTYVTVLVAVGTRHRHLVTKLVTALRHLPTVCVAQAVV